MVSLLTVLCLMQVPDTTRQDIHLGEASVMARRNTALHSGAPRQVVTAGEIAQRGADGLHEVLQTLAGVSVKDYGGIGGLKTVSIRSFGAQHTGICYDGLVVTDVQNGQVDISRFDLDHLRSVQVETAGSDDIFRPARLASYVGVVTLSHDRPSVNEGEPPLTGDVKLRYGSFGTFHPALHLRGTFHPRWSLTASASYLRTAGNYPFLLHNGNIVTKEMRSNSQVSRGNAEVTLHGDLGSRGTLRLRASHLGSSRGLPGSVILYTDNAREHLWDRITTASLLHEASGGAAPGDLPLPRWSIRSSLSYTHQWNRYIAQHPAADDRYTQQQGTLSVVGLWRPSRRWSVSLAEDVDLGHLAATTLSTGSPLRLTSFTALSGRYADSRLTATATLLGIASREWTNDAVTTGTRTGQTVKGHERLCPSLSLSWAPLGTGRNEDVWHLRLAYKETMRFPTFNDLYYLQVGNANLRPELARQLNVGTTLRLDVGNETGTRPAVLELTADSYYNNIADKIVAIPTLFIWHMRNVGRVEMWGTDLSAAYGQTLTDWFSLRVAANYSWQYAVDVTDAAAKNYLHQIPYTPRHTGSIVASLRFFDADNHTLPPLSLTYTLNAVGERYSLAQNTAAYRIAPYQDHSLCLTATFRAPLALRHCRMVVSAEALNLAGNNYEIIQYYPMAGRQYRLGLKISL